MASLDFKVYNGKQEFVAATRYAEDAAAIVTNWGEGTTIKYGGRIVWKEGEMFVRAGDSYDVTANIIWKIIHEHRREREEKHARSRAAYERERSATTT